MVPARMQGRRAPQRRDAAGDRVEAHRRLIEDEQPGRADQELGELKPLPAAGVRSVVIIRIVVVLPAS